MLANLAIENMVLRVLSTMDNALPYVKREESVFTQKF